MNLSRAEMLKIALVPGAAESLRQDNLEVNDLSNTEFLDRITNARNALYAGVIGVTVGLTLLAASNEGNDIIRYTSAGCAILGALTTLVSSCVLRHQILNNSSLQESDFLVPRV